jgi:hypothetical protein
VHFDTSGFFQISSHFQRVTSTGAIRFVLVILLILAVSHAAGAATSFNTQSEPTRHQFNSSDEVFILGMHLTANGFYTAGRHVVLYDGQGTLTYGSEATLISRSPGRDVINVVPANKGMDLRIVATDPRHSGNYLRSIRVVTAADEAAAKAGQIFTPAFLKLIQNLRALRFMVPDQRQYAVVMG